MRCGPGQNAPGEGTVRAVVVTCEPLDALPEGHLGFAATTPCPRTTVLHEPTAPWVYIRNMVLLSILLTILQELNYQNNQDINYVKQTKFPEN